MDGIKIFKSEQYGEIRTVLKQNNEPLFCLADVCKALGLSNTTMVKQSLKQDGLSITEVIDSLGRKQEATFVSEGNLYKVIFQSRKEEAGKFQDWVTEEVLPSIRKHGIYATDNVIDQIMNNPDFGIGLLTRLKEERLARTRAESTITILTHTNKTYTCTEVAKELGLKSASDLNAKLHRMGIQFKQNNTWVPYTKYAELAWFQIKQEVLDNGHIIYHRRITGVGRQAIIELLSAKYQHEQ